MSEKNQGLGHRGGKRGKGGMLLLKTMLLLIHY